MGLTAALGIGSALIGASSSSKAANAQQAAAASQVEESRAAREQTAEFFAPYRESGQDALAARNFLLGLGPRPTFGGTPAEITTRTIPGGAVPNYDVRRVQDDFAVFDGGNEIGRFGNMGQVNAFTASRAPSQSTQYMVGDNQFATMEEAQAFARENPVGGTEYGGFQKSPGFDFRLEQGTKAVDMSAASRGGLNSGATLKAQTEFGQNFGSNEFNNYLNQITGAAASGQNAAGAQAANNQFYSSQINNSLGSAGNAASAGAIGFGNAIQGGINNVVGYMGQQNALNALRGGNNGGSNWLFGGNSWG